MKKLDLEEMENVQGGGGTEDWCDGINMLKDSGFDFGSVDSGSYVAYLYSVHC